MIGLSDVIPLAQAWAAPALARATEWTAAMGGPMVPLAAAHLVCAGGAVGIALARRRQGLSPVAFFALMSIVALGPIGVFGAALMGILHRIFARTATPFAQWYATLFPEADIDRPRSLHDLIRLRGAGPGERSTVAPFADILALGSVQQKQSVITLIADNFIPAFAPALRSALNDPEPAIRVQAATAAARIENDYLIRSMQLQEARQANPSDAALTLAQARQLDDYAQTGLLDTGRANAVRQSALALYESLPEDVRGTPAIAEAAGRLLVQLGRCQDAVAQLDPWLKQPSPGLIACYVEALFELKRYDGVRRACAQFGALLGPQDMPARIRDALAAWSEPAHARLGGGPG
ncbi:hypothetical protein [Alsobacter sp. SYSU BS001988]